MIVNIQSDCHTTQLQEALERSSGHSDILLLGSDSVASHSDRLWIISPLIRQIIGSLANVQQNTVILPDFSDNDIKTALDVIEGSHASELVLFNSRTKSLLECLGIDCKTVISGIRMKSSFVKIKNGKFDEYFDKLNDESDEEGDSDDENDSDDDLQKLFLAQNEGFDDSSSEEEDNDDDDNDDDDISSEEDDDDGSDENNVADTPKDDTLSEDTNLDIQSQLLLDQDFSDSEDDDDKNDDEKEAETIVGENEDNRNEKSQEGNPEKLHQEKLVEVEKLLLRENDEWKCKVCDKTFGSKGDLRRHAEIHVDGLYYPCQFCSRICPTKSSLSNHIHSKHGKTSKNTKSNDVFYRDDVEEKDDVETEVKNEVNKKKQNQDGNPDQTKTLHQEKLMEVEKMVSKSSVDNHWKCVVCDKTWKNRGDLWRHVEIHVEGLSYHCQLCSKICPNKTTLKNHTSKYHRINSTSKVSKLSVLPKNDDSYKEKVDVVTESFEEKKKDKNHQSDPEKLHQEKLIEVQNLLLKENNLWKCKACDKTWRSRRDLQRHAEIHVEGLSYRCQFCSRTFSGRNKLGVHIHKKHRNSSKVSESTDVSNPNASFERLIDELSSNSDIQSNRKIKDEKRDSNNEILKKLKCLIRQRSSGIWECKKCLKRKENKADLLCHVETHLDLSLPCSKCSFTSRTRKNLRKHFRDTHRGV